MGRSRRLPSRSPWAAAVLVFGTLSPSGAAAQPAAPAVPPARASIRGVVTTQGGEVRLPGVTLALETGGPEAREGQPLARTVSDEEGRFELVGLPPGPCRLTASLDGFRDLEKEAGLEAGRTLELELDLELAAVAETLSVSPGGLEGGTSLGPASAVDFYQPQTAPQGDVGVETLLPLVPGVVRGPAGLSVKGGRPTQSSLVLGSVDLADPSTGEASLRMPGDAVGSMEVLPSPSAVEYGRFSSGVTVIRPRRGRDVWRVALASINPAFETKRGEPLTVIGVESFSPRLLVRGPLGRRVLVAQSLQYRYSNRDVRSRPQDERKRTEGVGSFTRLDATLGSGHTLTATALAFVETRDHETLGTFDPPEVAASRRQRVFDATVSEGASLGQGTSLESTLHAKLYDVTVFPQGSLPMELRPEERAGSYFNDQTRRTWAFQWRETLSGVRQHLGGTHFYKAGVDVVRGAFDGTSTSHPVEVWRADSTLASRTTFEPRQDREASATDVALFVQDRWQPVEPVVLEAGLRLDRIGVVRAWSVSPRLGARVRLGPGGRVTLGGGFGRFVESVPLAVGSVDWLEPRTVTRFDADGRTPTDVQRFAPRVGPAGLQAPRALTGHLELDLRLTGALSVHSHVLGRQGDREHLLVQEVESGSGWLTLDGRGASRYRELGLGARYTRGTRLTADVSYVRSSARADVNASSTFLGSLREPFVRPNAFARADVPDRLVAQVRGAAGEWRWASALEWRSGLPYSAFDELQEYVGTPNEAGRLPAFASLDASVERRFHVGKLRAWVGLQFFNILGRFNPQDVQRNVDAPDFGTFYNSEPLRVRLTLRL
jgi:hypothetical protein